MKNNNLNGIDTTRLLETINAVRENPSLAKFQFRTKSTWMNGGHSRSVIKGFFGAGKEDDTRATSFIFDTGQPASLLGNDDGPTPVEYVLLALAGCLTNSIIYYCAAKGITIEDVELELEGNFDLRFIFGFPENDENIEDNIKVNIRIKGNNLSVNDKKFLAGLGKKTSPVYRIITSSFPVEVVVEN